MYGFQKEFGLYFSYNKKRDRKECFGDSKSSLCYKILLAIVVSLIISNVIIWDFGMNKISFLAFIVCLALTSR